MIVLASGETPLPRSLSCHNSETFVTKNQAGRNTPEIIGPNIRCRRWCLKGPARSKVGGPREKVRAMSVIETCYGAATEWPPEGRRGGTRRRQSNTARVLTRYTLPWPNAA